MITYNPEHGKNFHAVEIYRMVQLESIRYQLVMHWHQLGTSAEKTKPMESYTNLKIFLVDDEPFHSALVAQQLNNLGYKNIHTFLSGTDCLHHLNENPDIIILDYNMEGHSGFEVLTKIKRFDPNIFVVMLSGQEDLETAVSCLKYGAFDYIVKNNDMGNKIDYVLQRIAVIRQELEKENQPTWKKFIMTLI